MNRKLLRFCLAVPLTAGANILMALATALMMDEPKKRVTITLPEESPWRLLVDPDYEAD